jgi:hypothetical protein
MQLSPSREAASCSATQEFRNILRNPKFHFRFTWVIHWSLPWEKPIQSITLNLTPLRSILILYTNLRLGLPSGLFPSGFPTNIIHAFLFSPNSCYMPCPSHPPWLDHSNYTWRRVQITKLLVMQFSSLSRHFVSLRYKYPPQHPVLNHPQSTCLPYLYRPSFTPIQKHRQHFSSAHSNCYGLA